MKTKKSFVKLSKQLLARIQERITSEYLCDMCNTRILGEYIDCESDPGKGIKGIALCPKCLGTGKYQKNKKWDELQNLAKEAIGNNYCCWFTNKNGEYPFEETERNNEVLRYIASKALKMIKHPRQKNTFPICMAEIIARMYLW